MVHRMGPNVSRIATARNLAMDEDCPECIVYMYVSRRSTIKSVSGRWRAPARRHRPGDREVLRCSEVRNQWECDDGNRPSWSGDHAAHPRGAFATRDSRLSLDR